MKSELVNERSDPFNSASWTEEERAYYTSVALALREREDKLISNGRPEHAAYLIKLLIANAKTKVRLVSGGLPEKYEDGTAVFGNRYIVAAVMGFLSRPATALHILVHGDLKDVDDASEHSLVWAAESLKERDQLQGTLKIQNLSDYWVKAMRERNILWHWMTMDESAYRLERDVTKPAAIANFGEPTYASALAGIFDTIAGDESENEILACVQP